MKAELFYSCGAKLAEGPVYNSADECLYWVDIDGCAIHKTKYDGSSDTKIDTSLKVSAVALVEGGGLLAAMSDGVHFYKDGRFTKLANLDEPEGNRFNDGKVDSKGRFWIGSMNMTGISGTNSLYLFDKGVLTKKHTGVTISNGIGYSLDEKYMYYIDTPSRMMYRFDYDAETGNIENQTDFIDYSNEQGGFDGMTVDSSGMLWIAQWGGHQISVWDPVSRKKEAMVEVPVTCVSSCEFGGPDLKTLYITTAKIDEEPLSGSVFVCRDTGGASGKPQNLFKM